jgi:GTP cyclohydrolase IA
MSFQPDGEVVPDAVDTDRIERAVREILVAIGEDPNRDGLRETPARVGRMWGEVIAGLHDDPDTHLDRRFLLEHNELVMVRDIRFASLCEHHLLPFLGRAHVAYIPGAEGAVTGLSKLARLVEGYARRLQVQERMTSQIADALMKQLDASGALVVIEAEHLCMSMRGVRKPGALTITSAVRGHLQDSPAARAEALAFIHNGK